LALAFSVTQILDHGVLDVVVSDDAMRSATASSASAPGWWRIYRLICIGKDNFCGSFDGSHFQIY